MEVYCTRPRCSRPQNFFPDLDDPATLRTVQQKYCMACGMPLILRDRYVPIKVLGRGGFGAAFLARDRDTPRMRLCVVKQFQPVGNMSDTQLQLAQNLFEREAEVLEEIGSQHDHIPDLFAYFTVKVPGLQPGLEDKFFYLAQEYIDGQNLEEELIEKNKFSEAEVVEVLQEILKILQFVHDKGIIHRDIKPSNIMRRRDGRLFLLDFGAVKQVTKVPVGTGNSSTGIYSQGFAPPEQMSGGQVYPSTDLYALAVTIITLLTGQEPTQLFDSYSNQWKWKQYAQASSQLASILDKMLLSPPNQRFQSAGEALSALANVSAVFLPPTHVPPQPPIPVTQPPQPLQPPPPLQPRFTTLEVLVGAAFSGFEGALIGIALFSLLKSPVLTLIASSLILGVMIFAQWRRWIGDSWLDRLLIPGITLGIIYFLGTGFGLQEILIFAVAGALVAVALTSLFRLIYNLLSMIL